MMDMERVNRLPTELRRYLLQALPTHLVDASQLDRLRRLLADFDFIQAKVAAFGPQPMIDDYGLAGPALPEHEGNLRAIQDVLRLSAHVVAQDPAQLAGQILGHLSLTGGSETRAIRAGAEQWNEQPWLRPIAPSLTQPGGSLSHQMGSEQSLPPGMARYGCGISSVA
jgi:hypothetical protein